MESKRPSRAVQGVTSGVVVLAAVVVAIVGYGCSSGQPAAEARAVEARKGPSRPPGHERMVAVLRDVAAAALVNNVYAGQNGIDRLRATVAGLPKTLVEEGMQARVQLGLEELRLGNTDAAVKALEGAYEIVREHPRHPAYPHVLFQLGVAHVRVGENANCVARHTAESCLVPIEGGGVHVAQEGSRSAIRVFTELLETQPDDLRAVWLLNVAAMTVGEYPDGVPERHRIPKSVFDSDEPFPRFRDAAPMLGLNTRSLAGGVIVDDFDGDHRFDLVVSTMDPAGQVRFWHANPDGTFTDRTEEAGLVGITGGLNMVHADYDNDGNLDVYVLRGAWLGPQGNWPNSLLRGGGDGTFTDVTFDAGLGESHHPTQAAGWADYDNDGDLDLYVGNESDGVTNPSQLFRNDGDGTFTDVARQAGVENLRYAKGVTWGDYDADTLPDLYVSNLWGENRLYHNLGDGTFADVAKQLGVTGPVDSFPAWFWDFDNDGNLDLHVATFYSGREPNRLAAVVASLVFDRTIVPPAALYRGDGKGGFEDVAKAQGLEAITLTMGANFGDLDNDGWLDMYLGTGYPLYEGIIPNVMYRNRGGTGFADVTTAGGFGHLQKGHGVVFADLDADGDQDVFEQIGGAFPGDAFGDVLFENPGFGNSWISVKLVGVVTNRAAIGARLRLRFQEEGRERSVTRWVCSGGSFGGNPFRAHVGLGKATLVDELEVFWPTTGKTQTFRGVMANRAIQIVEGSDQVAELPIASASFRAP